MNSSGVDALQREALRTRVKPALVYAFAAACLVWVFHDVHPRRLLASMSIANWWLVALAIIVDILTYVLQGVRWKLLLAPVGRLSSMRATQGIYAGLFTNELVPLRFGELVRAFLVSRWLSSRFTSVLPSMVIERFLDALWMVVAFGVAAIFVPIPKELTEVADLLVGVVLLASLLFLWIIFRKQKEVDCNRRRFSSRLLKGIALFASQLSRRFSDIVASYRFSLAALLSAGMLACQALALWFMMLACHLGLPLGAGIIVLLVVRLGTAIPNAPANVGSFQFFCVLALGLFGIEKTSAAGFSVVYFLALTVPLWILGLLAINSTGIRLSTILEGAALRRNSGQT